MEKETKLNLYQKVQKIRVELQEMDLKKSGLNKYADFKYYELADFLPAINKLSEKYGICNCISFDNDFATLIIYDVDSEATLQFTSPMRELALKGCNAIQALGGAETYSRRYLYLTAYEIVENDLSDAVAHSEDLVGKLNKMLSDEEKTAVLDKYQVRSLKQLPDSMLQKLIDKKMSKN